MDDGSRDGTVGVVSGYVKKHGFDAVRVLKATSNRGKGHAVKRAMMMARGERMLLLDADGATRLSDLEKLEEEMTKIETLPSSSTPSSDLYWGNDGKTGLNRQSTPSKFNQIRFRMLICLSFHRSGFWVESSHGASCDGQEESCKKLPDLGLSHPCNYSGRQQDQGHAMRLQAFHETSRWSPFPQPTSSEMVL